MSEGCMENKHGGGKTAKQQDTISLITEVERDVLTTSK
jgi:hypothetical protein